MLSKHFSFITHDWLTSFFAFLIIFVSIPIAIYSKGYAKEYKKHYSSRYLLVQMLCFILAMLGVVTANNGITFIVFWELMSIFSFLLVIFEYKNRENLKAGITYFIMTHISGLLLMAMFALLYKYTNALSFSDIALIAKKMTITQKSIIFIFALLGFGSKAGIVPLHAWLPKAHPAAPSNISALMSGIMLKVSIYGFIRVTFMFLGNTSSILGIAVVIIGTITAIFSILNALVQDDLKKLLAYSSAENIGIIFSTLGLTMLSLSYNIKTLAVISMTAALFHILNHAVFKSLLFTTAGGVLYATGTKNMNELGGLHKKIKFVTYCAFIGTAAISALPPLNGFASEIMILQSFIKGWSIIKSPGMALIVILCGITLALVGGVTIYACTKAFGITYLGEGRSIKTQKTHPIPFSMNLGMGILAGYCLIIGILSPYIVKIILTVANSVLGTKNYIKIDFIGSDIMVFSAFIIVLTALILSLSKILNRKTETEEYGTWGCGFNDTKPFMQYTSSGFSQPVTRVLGNIVGYKKRTKIKHSIFLKQKVSDLIENYLYEPIVRFVDFTSEKTVKIHYGKIQIYLAYIFISLIVTAFLVTKYV